jgi:hypothetical protein
MGPMICKRDVSSFESSNLPEMVVGLGLLTNGTSRSTVTTTLWATAEHCNDCCGLCDGADSWLQRCIKDLLLMTSYTIRRTPKQ